MNPSEFSNDVYQFDYQKQLGIDITCCPPPSFEEIHIIYIESRIDSPLQTTQKFQLTDFPRLHLPMLLENLDPVLLPLDLRHQFRVIINEIVEEWRNDDIIIAAGVAVAIDAQVQVDRYHRIVDDPAA
jgi:hypothetical protein